MDCEQAKAVIGLGTTTRVTVAEVLAAIDEAVRRLASALKGGQPDLACGLAALSRPAIDLILREAAQRAGLSIALLPLHALEKEAGRCVSHSERVRELYGVPSVAEAAALAVAGPQGKLVVPRFTVGNATASVAVRLPRRD